MFQKMKKIRPIRVFRVFLICLEIQRTLPRLLLKFYLPIDQGTTYVTATCIEDWDLAKSSSADERNYTEGTYKEFEYFTYDGVEPAFEGDTVDNSIYLYVHGSRDHYMKFQINVQKDGKMLEFSNKQAVVESLMDHISEVEG